MSTLNTADYDYPEQATPAAWYEIYRAEEKGSDDVFQDLKLFMSWLESKGVMASLSEAAAAVELYH